MEEQNKQNLENQEPKATTEAENSGYRKLNRKNVIIFGAIVVGVIALVVTLILTLGRGGKNGGGSNSTTITAQEWEALKTTTNYTIKISGQYKRTSENSNEKYTYTYKHQIDSSDTIMREQYSLTEDGETESETYYYMIKDGVKYEIEQDEDDNRWYAYSKDWDPTPLYDYVTDYATVEGYDVDFDDLTYDSRTRAYVYTKEDGNRTTTISYYFKNGKLSKVVMEKVSESTNSLMKETTTIEVSNYGNADTRISLPSYRIAD